MSEKISTVIVEDELSNQQVLKNILDKYCPDIEVMRISGTYEKAISDINECRPSLVFLDIKLDDNYTAFDLLDQLDDLNVFIVFVTAYDEYAKKAINEVDAIFYISKPVKITELEKAVSKVKLKLKSGDKPNHNLEKLNSIKGIVNPLNKIMFPTKSSFEFVDINNIIRIQALGNYVQVFSAIDKRYTIYQKLSYYEDRLKDHNFLRVHRSHLINLAQVNTFQKSGRGGIVKMKDDSKVQIAPGYKQEFMNKF